MGIQGDTAKSCNFQFLEEHDPVFLQLATTAEQVFSSAPDIIFIKLQQLGEALAQNIVNWCGVEFDE